MKKAMRDHLYAYGLCWLLETSVRKIRRFLRTDVSSSQHSYSAFNDIIDAIAALDADVISLENSRSGGELLEVFRQTSYDKEIGPGVYDIHSPRIPTVDEIEAMLRATLQVLPLANVWVNPDCGLKTRTWEEVIPALEHMVAAARQVRSSLPLQIGCAGY